MKTRKASSGEDVGLRPALSPEARENQMISLAVDLVEKRLREGTASSAETTYYLRLSGSKARLEKEKLEEENKFLRAKKKEWKGFRMCVTQWELREYLDQY